MEQLALLALIAHPGDELPVAGTLARHAASGVRVNLACTLRSGPVPGPAEHALRCSAAHLGVTAVSFLPFLRGELLSRPACEVVRALVHEIRRLRPQVVLTFGPDGINGDGEHIATGGLASQAAGAAGDRDQFPLETGEDLHDPDRVYRFGLPTGLLRLAGLPGTATPDEAVPVREEVGQFLPAKLAAASCYGDALEQPLAGLLRLDEPERDHLLGTEFLNLALPQPATADRADPHLFAGLP